MVRFVHSQSWPWQKPVQKEKVDLLHCVVRFCSSNLNCDRNLCKKKNLIFFLHCVVRFCSSNLDLICAKRKSWSFLLCGKICALPILTVTEICAKRKSWSLTLCGEILQFQSWPWQKSVQKEKVFFFFFFYTMCCDFAVQILTLTEICAKRKSWYFLHCVVRFCTPNADLDRNLFKKNKNSLLLYVVRFLHSQSWPWQKSVQTEKVDLLHCVVRFCSSSLDLDRNLCKRKKFFFFFFTPCGVILQSKSWPWLKSVQKEKVDIFYTVWWDFALQMLTLTEICSKRIKILFYSMWCDFCTPSLDHDRNLCKQKKLISYTVWWDFAVPVLTLTEICAKGKSFLFFFLHRVVWFCSPNLDLDWNLCKKKKLIFFTLCGEILHSKCWPWQKSVQKEKILFYSMWCDFCTPNLDRDRNLCKQKKLISYTVWWDFAVPILTFDLWISTAACSLFEHWWQRTVEQIKPISR